MKAPHPDVERLTVESTLCTFCVVEGGREEALASAFYWGVQAAMDRPISLCDAHRIRLSFYFELSELIAASNTRPPKVP